jgi:hypothetical protein
MVSIGPETGRENRILSPHFLSAPPYNSGMTLPEFRASLNEAAPAAGLSPLLAALWWDAKGNWEQAHEIAQDVNTPDGAWVHAYLHRKEGDNANAGYWYRQARRSHSRLSLAEEWDEIVAALLSSGKAARE